MESEILELSLFMVRAHLEFCLFSLFNTVPLHSLNYNSQRLNLRNRGLELVTNWSKELVLIKECRD